MSELIDRQAALDVLCDACGNCACPKGKIPRCSYYEKMQAIPTASPWHRVEEPPKKHGKYPVCWIENGNFYWQEAHYCYYQDGDKWVAWSSYQGDDVEITPDYWMPIETPKEDA